MMQQTNDRQSGLSAAELFQGSIAVGLGSRPRELLVALSLAHVCLLAADALAQDATSPADLRERWFDATLIGDIEAMAAAAEAGVDVDQKDATGATALITAALGGDAAQADAVAQAPVNGGSEASG